MCLQRVCVCVHVQGKYAYMYKGSVSRCTRGVGVYKGSRCTRGVGVYKGSRCTRGVGVYKGSRCVQGE